MAVYTITNVGANKCLNINGSNLTTNSLWDGRPVNIWTSSGSMEQKWIVHSFTDGGPILSYINRNFGLNALRSSTTEYKCNIRTVEGNTDDSEVVYESVTGGYKIKLKKWNKFLTVKESANGSTVYWSAQSNSNYQVWKFTKQNIIETSTGTIYAKVGNSTTGALTEAQMKSNATYIYNFLKGKGFTREAACGVLGNFEKESHMNPGIWHTVDVITKAYGIAQWKPGTKFINWAYDLSVIDEPTAKAVDDLANGTSAQKKNLMDAELAFMLWYGTTGEGFIKNDDWDWDEYKGSDDLVRTLAKVFNTYYENSGSDGEDKADYAEKWYKYFTK